MMCILVFSRRNTSSCNKKNIWLSWLRRNHLNVLVGVWVQILHRVGISHSSILSFHNQLWTRFYIVVKCFTVCTCLHRTLEILGKVSWLSIIITYDLASSSAKSSSSLLLSSTSKISTPPFAEGIVAVVDTNFVDIVAKDIVVVDITVLDIELDHTKVALIQLAYARHFSSSGYPPSFLVAAEVLYNPSHRVLMTCKIYSTYYLVYLQSSVNTNILPTYGI